MRWNSLFLGQDWGNVLQLQKMEHTTSVVSVVVFGVGHQHQEMEQLPVSGWETAQVHGEEHQRLRRGGGGGAVGGAGGAVPIFQDKAPSGLV